MSDHRRIIQPSRLGSQGTHQEEGYSFLYGYSVSIERFPVLICFLILLVTFGSGAITYYLNGIPSFDVPTLGLDPRGTVISSRSLSFNKFIVADPEILSPIPQVTRLNQDIQNEFGVATTENTVPSLNSSRSKRQISQDNTTERCPYPSFALPKLVFESANGEDLFQLSHLKSMCRHESNLLRAHPIFLSDCERFDSFPSTDQTCCPSWSLGYAVALLNNKSSCEDIDVDDVARTKNTLEFCSSFYISGELTSHCADRALCLTIPYQCTASPVVFSILHYLAPTSFAEDASRGVDNFLAYAVSFSPILLCEEPECEENMERIYDDNFSDLTLLDDGITKVLGIDFSIKSRHFRRQLLSDLEYVAFGILTAIVIIWMYTRSLFITVGALLNMLMSLISAAFFYYVVFGVKFFPFVNIVSCVLVIGIGADDTFVYVDLWRAAKAKIGKERENRVLVIEDATKHAVVTLFVTSLTTSSALYATTISYVAAGKCFGIFAGTALAANFVYTITWLPAIIVIHDKYFVLHSDRNWRHFVASCLLGTSSKLLYIPRAFFNKLLPFLIVTLRFLWIPLFLLVGVTGFVLTFAYPRLQLQESGEFQLFQESQPFERYDQVYKDDLGFERDVQNTLPITFIWGVLPTTNENLWDPLDFGTLELDPNFSIGSTETQTWLSDFCAQIKEQTFYNRESENEGHFCFIDSFMDYMRRPCAPWENGTCCEQQNFPFPADIFHKCVVDFALFRCKNYPCLGYTPGLRFDKNNSLIGLYLNFPSSVSYTLKFKPIDEFWTNLSSWTEGQISTAPDGLGGGWSYSQRDLQVPFYDLQSIVVESTVFTISISLGAATLVLLLTTQNVLLTLYAILSITLTVSSVIGCVVLLGWKLNIFEAMTFSLAVGLAVDFTIHYGVAYKLAPIDDRKGRTLYAIETLSSSITAAALSTFAAGAVMIPAIIVNYSQIGVFLTLIMSFSWLFSTFFFLSLCITVGPQGECGQVCRVQKLCRKKFSGVGGIDNPSFVDGN